MYVHARTHLDFLSMDAAVGGLNACLSHDAKSKPEVAAKLFPPRVAAPLAPRGSPPWALAWNASAAGLETKLNAAPATSHDVFVMTNGGLRKTREIFRWVCVRHCTWCIVSFPPCIVE